MSPREQILRAACVHMGVDPDKWTAFRDIGEVVIRAFLASLPEDLARAVGEHLQAPMDTAS